MKIRPVGAELFHADGQTDMAELTVAFHSFASAPKRNKTFHQCTTAFGLSADIAPRILKVPTS